MLFLRKVLTDMHFCCPPRQRPPRQRPPEASLLGTARQQVALSCESDGLWSEEPGRVLSHPRP